MLSVRILHGQLRSLRGAAQQPLPDGGGRLGWRGSSPGILPAGTAKRKGARSRPLRSFLVLWAYHIQNVVLSPVSGFTNRNVVVTPFGTAAFRDAPPVSLIFPAFFHCTPLHRVPLM
jgi:hypothetical protein